MNVAGRLLDRARPDEALTKQLPDMLRRAHLVCPRLATGETTSCVLLVTWFGGVKFFFREGRRRFRLRLRLRLRLGIRPFCVL